MKVAINTTFGGFRLTKEIRGYLCDMCGWSRDKVFDAEFHENLDLRSNSDLIEGLELFPHASIRIMDVPKEATDVRIFEYDGLESLWCVIDGRMEVIR